MTSEDTTENPLHREDTYSGKIFWLNTPTGYNLDFENLRNQLHNRTFHEDATAKVSSAVNVPDIFKDEDENVVRTTTIGETSLHKSDWGNILYSEVLLDDLSTVHYRGQEILILDNTEAQLLVLEHDGFYYLVILGNRKIADQLAEALKAEYDQFGSMINDAAIPPEALGSIRQELDADLMDTIISGYPEEELDSIRMKGTRLEQGEEYKRQKSRGKLQTHMFHTMELAPDEEKTVGLSRDGLVRIYSKSTISVYLRLVVEYILPHIARPIESSPTLDSYNAATDAETIFRPTGGG